MVNNKIIHELSFRYKYLLINKDHQLRRIEEAEEEIRQRKIEVAKIDKQISKIDKQLEAIMKK